MERRKPQWKFEKNQQDKYIYLNNFLGDSVRAISVEIKNTEITKAVLEDGSLLKNPELYSVVNRFFVHGTNDENFIVTEGDFVLFSIQSLFETHWYYGFIGPIGEIISYRGNKPLSSINELYIVSGEEFYVNTSCNYRDSHPEYRNLINPNTNDYF